MSWTCRLALAALTLAPLLGCADNSGGPPPEGTELTGPTRAESVGTSLACDLFRDDAFLWHDAADVQAFLDADCTNADQAVAGDLLQTADTLADGEALVGVSIGLGGCLGAFEVQGFYLAEPLVTAWLLRADSSYGRNNVACTTDIGGAFEVWRVPGAAVATEAELMVGTYNPELPGAPAAVTGSRSQVEGIQREALRAGGIA